MHVRRADLDRKKRGGGFGCISTKYRIICSFSQHQIQLPFFKLNSRITSTFRLQDIYLRQPTHPSVVWKKTSAVDFPLISHWYLSDQVSIFLIELQV